MLHHGKKTPKLSRTTSHRDAMLGNMAASLFLYSKITTTSTKAKALRPFVDKLIMKAKEGSLHSKRLIASEMPHKEALKKLFQELAPKLSERKSGFSRVIKAGFRRGDMAELSVVELLIDKPVAVSDKPEGEQKKKAAKGKSAGASKATAKSKPKAKAKAAKAAK